MRLYLINPSNPLISIVKVKESRWNRYRVWKPLSLMVLAGLTPSEWETSIVDENLGVPDYPAMPRPDLVGITAFTSQANGAYEVADHFRRLGVPVIMGGIHATMCLDEVQEHVDSVVTREADSVWPHVLEDARQGRLKRRYDGGFAEITHIPSARHDLLSGGYAFGAIQTTRGCPLNCSFCSVTAFNGAHYRQRPIPDVMREFQSIREKLVLVVDDNLIGTRPEHIARAKDLFRALARANLHKEWIAQATINFADDEELLALAAKAGCSGVFIGFESPSSEGLLGYGGKFTLLKDRDITASVRRIRRHKILVAGSFIIGLDVDEPGIGNRIAEVARQYGVDNLNVLFLTPLPGTRLWNQMKSQGRIPLDRFPQDWKYYTLTCPVARYKHLSLDDIIREMTSCKEAFYSVPCIFHRVAGSFWHRRKPLINLAGNLFTGAISVEPPRRTRISSANQATGTTAWRGHEDHNEGRILNMGKNAKTKLRGRELAVRLVGISTPVGGIDWEPPAEEREKAKQVLKYLAEQRALWDPYDMAIGSFVTESILDVRERLSHDLKDVPGNSVLGEGLRAMQAACRVFWDENQSPRSGYGPPYEAQLHSTLGELRALFGIHIARIACAYDLEVDRHLVGILPPEPD